MTSPPATEIRIEKREDKVFTIGQLLMQGEVATTNGVD
jgi:hypothetical protein